MAPRRGRHTQRGTPGKSVTTPRSAKKNWAGKRVVAGALKQSVMPRQQLAKVVGKGPMTRADLTKRVWAYIKKNSLQDRKNRRMVHADDVLLPVFRGKRTVSMFEMTKLVNRQVDPGDDSFTDDPGPSIGHFRK